MKERTDGLTRQRHGASGDAGRSNTGANPAADLHGSHVLRGNLAAGVFIYTAR